MTRDDARDLLRQHIRPGDTVRTILRHVSRTGMTREVSPVVIGADGDTRDWTYAVADLLGEKVGTHGGIRLTGAGMDMGFALVYAMSLALWPEYECLGDAERYAERCPSPDHVNGPKPAPYGGMTHRDGYALAHRWL